jgi:fatty acid desaturase
VYANAQTIFAVNDTITATSGVDRLAPRFLRRAIMLYTIAIILVVLWALGLVSAYTVGGFIHVLLVLAIIIILLQVISGRRIV